MTERPEGPEEPEEAIAAMSASELVIEIENTMIELMLATVQFGPGLDRLRLLRREIIRRMSR